MHAIVNQLRNVILSKLYIEPGQDRALGLDV